MFCNLMAIQPVLAVSALTVTTMQINTFDRDLARNLVVNCHVYAIANSQSRPSLILQGTKILRL